MYLNLVGGFLSRNPDIRINQAYKEFIPVAPEGKPLVFTPELGEGHFNQTEEVGHFEMGSSVVLIFEAPKNFKLEVEEGKPVKYGQVIGRVPSNE